MKELKQSDCFKFEGWIYQIKRELTSDSWGNEITRVFLIKVGKSRRNQVK